MTNPLNRNIPESTEPESVRKAREALEKAGATGPLEETPETFVKGEEPKVLEVGGGQTTPGGGFVDWDAMLPGMAKADASTTDPNAPLPPGGLGPFDPVSIAAELAKQEALPVGMAKGLVGKQEAPKPRRGLAPPPSGQRVREIAEGMAPGTTATQLADKLGPRASVASPRQTAAVGQRFARMSGKATPDAIDTLTALMSAKQEGHIPKRLDHAARGRAHVQTIKESRERVLPTTHIEGRVPRQTPSASQLQRRAVERAGAHAARGDQSSRLPERTPAQTGAARMSGKAGPELDAIEALVGLMVAKQGRYPGGGTTRPPGYIPKETTRGVRPVGQPQKPPMTGRMTGKKQEHPVSEAQRRWAWAAEERGELPKGKARTWSRRVKGEDLPAHTGEMVGKQGPAPRGTRVVGSTSAAGVQALRSSGANVSQPMNRQQVEQRVNNPKRGKQWNVSIGQAQLEGKARGMGGPFVGPKGGLYRDQKHTQPWRAADHAAHHEERARLHQELHRKTKAGEHKVHAAVHRVKAAEYRKQVSRGDNPQMGREHLAELTVSKSLRKAGGPYIGPKGGKWADPQHKIPWKEGGSREAGGGKAASIAGVRSALRTAKPDQPEWHPQETIERFRRAVDAAAKQMHGEDVSMDDAKAFVRDMSSIHTDLLEARLVGDSEQRAVHQMKLSALQNIVHKAAKRVRDAHMKRASKSLDPIDMLKAVGGGWQTGPRGGIRRRVGNKWEYKGKGEPGGGRGQGEAEDKPLHHPDGGGRHEGNRGPTSPDELEFSDIEGKELRVRGKNHAEIAAELKRGIDKAADLCQTDPPVCEGNLGVERDWMPQFDTEKDPGAIKKFLDEFEAEGVKVQRNTTLPIGKLKATQREIKTKKSYEMALARKLYERSLKEGKGGRYYSEKLGKETDWHPGADPLVVSKDGYVLDGHHRYAAMVVADPSYKMPVHVVDATIEQILDKTQDWFEQGKPIMKEDFHNNRIDPASQKGKSPPWKKGEGKTAKADPGATLIKSVGNGMESKMGRKSKREKSEAARAHVYDVLGKMVGRMTADELLAFCGKGRGDCKMCGKMSDCPLIGKQSMVEHKHMRRSEDGYSWDIRKGGVYSFADHAGEATTPLPADLLPELLAAFLEEALEHERQECEHRNVVPMAGQDIHEFWADRVMGELVLYMRRNKDLARAAKGKSKADIADILRARGLVKPESKSYQPSDRDSWNAMRGNVDGLSAEVAAFSASARGSMQPDLTKATPLTLREGPEPAQVVDDKADPFELARVASRQRFARANLTKAESAETAAHDCPIHGFGDLSKMMNLSNPHGRCKCG